MWVREIHTRHVDFFPWYWWAKATPSLYWSSTKDMVPISKSLPINILVSPWRFMPSKWRPCYKGKAHHLLHRSPWRCLYNRASHGEGVTLSTEHSRRRRSTPRWRVDDLPASHQDSKGTTHQEYIYGSLHNQTQGGMTLLSHSLLV